MKIIRLALRSIIHFKSYTLINILGLALSLACVIIIFRYVYGEFTVDHFNENLDRIYVTIEERQENPGEASFSGVYNPNKEKTFRDIRKHPAVEISSDYIHKMEEVIDVENQKYNATALIADSNFMKIMDYPVIEGVAQLTEPKTTLLTEKYAKKIFGAENPIGKTIRHSTGELLTVTGIIGQPASKSIFSFDMVVSYHLSEYWSRMSETLILLHTQSDYRSVNEDYDTFFEMSVWKISKRNQLYPLRDVYFNKQHIHSHGYNHGNYTYTIILLIVGFLILLIGIINFVNIYTVVMLRRGREFGMKKVFGADGKQVFLQLIAENLLMVGLAVILSILISQLAHPLLVNYLGLVQIPDAKFDIVLYLGFLILLPLVTSLYPFLRYNYSKPITSLRNIVSIGKHNISRRVFLSFQYILTMIMIILSLFFVKQLHYMLNTDPGYHTEDIIKVQFLNYSSDYLVRDSNEEQERKRNEKENIANLIKQKMDASPLFTSWSYGNSPNEYTIGTFKFKRLDGDLKNVNLVGADEVWLKLFGIQLAQGRIWDDNTEDEYAYNIIVSESALKLFDIKDFNTTQLQAERRIWWTSSKPAEEMETNPPYHIVGVIKDFYGGHLSKNPDPVIIYYSRGWREEPLMARIVPGRKQDAIKFLSELYDETMGGEFSYSFVEDEVNQMYSEDKKVAAIYSIFTLIAIIISSLGLFSMSLFDIQQRYREIAVRKVNGATYSVIVRILLEKYFILSGISFLIATPLAWLAINRYLEDFAYKAPISWWLFIIAFIITSIVSLFTLIHQTRKAANTNPAKVLKSE